jgi:hypothetical protein
VSFDLDVKPEVPKTGEEKFAFIDLTGTYNDTTCRIRELQTSSSSSLLPSDIQKITSILLQN